MPRWSIIVTTYKRPERLFQTLEKIFTAAAGVDAEVLIADDDPESTVDVLDDWVPDTIRYHRNETNLGAVGNVNAAIARSTGQIIHWCADDDWPDPGFYQAMERPFFREGVAVAHCGFRNHLPDGQVWDGMMLAREPRLLKTPAWAARLMFGNPTHMVATAFSRNAWDTLGGFDPQFPLLHDWLFLVKAACVAPSYFVPDRLANYTQQPQSLTGTASQGEKTDELRRMMDDLHQYVVSIS